MTPEQVVSAREKLGEGNILVFADNVKLFDETNKFVTFIWDDTKEFLHVIRINSNYYNNQTASKPWEHVMLGYDVIQYMTRAISKPDLKTTLDALLSEGLINDTQKQEIINEFYGLGKVQYPNTVVPEK